MTKYLVFGTEDGDQYARLGVVDATTHSDAQTKARELGEYSQYLSVTQYHVRERRPKDKTVTTWEDVGKDQLTFEDVVEEPVEAPTPEQDKQIREKVRQAEEALKE